MNYSNHPATKEYRRLLRMTETPTERMLWKKLKGKQLEGYRFRQQHGFGPYVLDFYCPEIRLGIELDGGIHKTYEQSQYDEARTSFIASNNIKVIRFENDVVYRNINSIIEEIREQKIVWEEKGKRWEADQTTPTPPTQEGK